MFQYEFREMIAMLVNAILALSVIASIIYGMTIMRKIGAATSETYTVQQVMDRNYEFNKFDGTELTPDECIVAFAKYINSDVKLCIQNPWADAERLPTVGSNLEKLQGEGLIWSKLDYRKRAEDGLTYSVEDIRLGKNNKGISEQFLYFIPYFNAITYTTITYEVRLGYDDEDPTKVFERAIEKNSSIGRVSSITFKAKGVRK